MTVQSLFFKRLDVRLTLVVTLAAAVASLIVSGLLMASMAFGYRDRDRAELDARLLSYWAAWQYGGNDAILERAAQDVKVHGGRPFLLKLDGPDGEMLGTLIPGEWEAFDLEASGLEMLHPGTYMTLRSERTSYALLVTGVRLDDGSRLVLGVSTENRQFLMRIYRRIYPLALAAIVLAGVVVGLIASRRLLAPIAGLNAEIDRIIVTADLSRRLESPGTQDQLDGLIGRYNRLLDRVESLIDGMRGTLDAVAHDLRTPLTRLRGHAELALSKDDAEARTEALGLVVEQTDQAGALLEALMDIAEAEQGMLPLEKRPCDMSAIAFEVCDMYEFVAEEKEQELRLDAPDPVEISGDPVRLRQILGNLLDNAVKYGPSGGIIDVRCFLDGREAVVDVIDDGPGVDEREAGRIFDRLYRGDKSRSSRGLGLGLSMVRALVEAHGGSISVGRADGRGARFRVRLPISRDDS